MNAQIVLKFEDVLVLFAQQTDTNAVALPPSLLIAHLVDWTKVVLYSFWVASTGHGDD